jgi:hypothetical protein
MDDREAGKERPGDAERPQEPGAAAPGRGGRIPSARDRERWSGGGRFRQR